MRATAVSGAPCIQACTQAQDSRTRTCCAGSGLTSLKGTPYWMAPEVVRGEKYGRKADIWSVGATVVEMLTGKHPWPATEHHFATFTQIATAKGGPPVPATVSRELKDFLSLCFARWARQVLELSVMCWTVCT